MHAAFGIHLGKGGENALAHPLAERRGRPLERGRLTEQDAIRTNADFPRARRGSARDRKQ